MHGLSYLSIFLRTQNGSIIWQNRESGRSENLVGSINAIGQLKEKFLFLKYQSLKKIAPLATPRQAVLQNLIKHGFTMKGYT